MPDVWTSMKARKVLIIAPEYPPSATVGAKRPAKLASRCGEFGWQGWVLTMAEGDYELTDTSSVTGARRDLAAADDDPEAISNALVTLLDPQAVAERFDLSIDAVRAYEAGGVIASMCGLFEQIAQP